MRARRSSLAVSFAVTALALSIAPPVSAQDAPPPPASGLVPPRPTNTIAPVYPEEKKATAESATVVLAITLDASGTVTDVSVTTSAGPEFDRAALEAGRKLTFSPAMRDGKPIAARIPFSFTFAYEKPAPPPAPITTSSIGGTVKTPTDEPLAGAVVTVTPPGGGPALTVTTDAKGAFRIDGLAPGKYRVSVVATGLEAYSADEDLQVGSLTDVTYRPRAVRVVDEAAPQEIEVVGERPPREVTRRVLQQREIAKMPGTNGDALRSLESMPGVARAPGLTAQLVVRGSGPNDTQVFVDGTPIPIAYHFGGLTSVVPTEALGKIDFTPGNFGPEYGRAMGGIVDIGLKSPRKDRWGGLLQVDLLDARALAEGPIGDKTRLLISARRSWVDAWLGSALRATNAVGVSAAPVYYDAQAILEHDLTPSTTARIAFLGSSDKLSLVFTAPQGSDPITGFGDSTTFWRLQARTDTRLSPDVRWMNTLAYGQDHSVLDFGDNFVDQNIRPLTLRSDFRARLGSVVTTVVGIEGGAASYDVAVKAPPIPVDGQDTGPFFARRANYLTANGVVYRPAGYAMVEVTPVAGLRLLPSVRADYASDIKEWTVSPRFAARMDVHPDFPRTTLKGGVGMYRQPPQPYESVAPFGTSNLKSNRSIHTSLGFEQELTKQIDVSVEGFYKKLDQLVVQQPAQTEVGVTYVNTGSGRVFGGEVLLKYKADERFFGWVAYTLSRSERRDADNLAYHVFEFDQTHILSVLGSYKLGRGWEVGGRFRYVTGNPYTPAVAGVFDADAGAYSPVNGATFSQRSPAFHRLDVRAEKTWTFESWKLSAYLDVQNAYNRRNPEGRMYNFNYTRSDIVAGLPILPVLGVRGEL
jgi:TonB family protein